ncbi:Cap-specific mRNA (nucleoside-2'-O-)-methyltransferase 2 [Amphibalanus amphitrite]|uniref:Cap-specific mRNA (nucleoside-2'-O-)-methyltransferase 2 n=1 Tax=Amphibalanus amphitrite TaxID=1232801 RepID=A0A6A4X0P8_AMPAM|nr:Cap-specific mRNA (nucleoside-2'-O-)-methyltransferase 2 [Amphibalanus amphitrite]
MYWEWRATTLNPYYEGNALSRMISDNRFILPTLDRWEFGADDTGDLLVPANAERLVASAGPGVNLVTADGSVDCQGQPAEQESVVSDLHTCEVLCALRTLQPGGTLVIKMFTFFEASSVCLLYVLNCCFDEVSVVKPSCSKAGNSEVYVVCRRRLTDGPPAQLLTTWWRHYSSGDGQRRPLLAREHVPDSFIQQIVSCARLFKSLQEAEIRRNLRLFAASEDDSGVWQELEMVRRAAVAEYVRRCRLTPIDKHLRLTHPLDTRLYTVFQVENKSGAGTYEQRTGSRSAADRLRSLGEQLAALPVPEPPTEPVLWRPSAPGTTDPSLVTTGRLPARLLASKFCCLHQVRLLVGALEAAAELRPALLAAEGEPSVSATPEGVTVTLPWRAEPWPCDAAAVTALRDGVTLLRPGQTLEVMGLYLVHRLNISLLQLMVARAGPEAAVQLTVSDSTPPVPKLLLRPVSDPTELVSLLDWVIPLVAAENCLSLLPLPQLCQRPAAEQLVAYNGRVVRAVTQYLVQCGGDEVVPGQTIVPD